MTVECRKAPLSLVDGSESEENKTDEDNPA
jgi:hypothetical protein